MAINDKMVTRTVVETMVTVLVADLRTNTLNQQELLRQARMTGLFQVVF